MKRTLLERYVLPFVQWYALMIVITIVIDYFLHRLKMPSIGLYFGYFGTILIVSSFVYSLRKRSLIKIGNPKQLLEMHEYMSWIGSILILVHAGIHYNALLPWLAIAMLLIAVASGLVGKFLLKTVNTAFKEKKQTLLNSGISPESVDQQLFYDAVTVDIMKKWRFVHKPITLILGILAFLHIFSIVLFSK